MDESQLGDLRKQYASNQEKFLTESKQHLDDYYLSFLDLQTESLKLIPKMLDPVESVKLFRKMFEFHIPDQTVRNQKPQKDDNTTIANSIAMAGVVIDTIRNFNQSQSKFLVDMIGMWIKFVEKLNEPSPDTKTPSTSPDTKTPSMSPDTKTPSMSPDTKTPSILSDGP